MTNSVFNAYSAYYDLLYADKDYTKETLFIQRILAEQNIRSGSVLEFGSGTGKHGSLLAKLGYNVHGVERSARMVEIAESSNGFSCEQGDIRALDLSRTFDAVIALFHVLSYQVTNDDVNSVFACAARHLKTGGVFLCDFWYTPAVLFHRPTVRIKRVANDNYKITRIAEPLEIPNENRVDVNYEIHVQNISTNHVSVINEVHSMRHFTIPELNNIAKFYGLSMLQSCEFLSNQPASENTWGVYIAFVKE